MTSLSWRQFQSRTCSQSAPCETASRMAAGNPLPVPTPKTSLQAVPRPAQPTGRGGGCAEPGAGRGLDPGVRGRLKRPGEWHPCSGAGWVVMKAGGASAAAPNGKRRARARSRRARLVTRTPATPAGPVLQRRARAQPAPPGGDGDVMRRPLPPFRLRIPGGGGSGRSGRVCRHLSGARRGAAGGRRPGNAGGLFARGRAGHARARGRMRARHNCAARALTGCGPAPPPMQVLEAHGIPAALSADLEDGLPPWPPAQPKGSSGARAEEAVPAAAAASAAAGA